MSTANEQPAEEKTLEEDLSAVIDEQLEEETEFLEDSEEETEETEDSDELEDESEIEEESLEAPTHWAANDRESFSKLSREGQEFVLRRHKEMEADYTKKTQETAQARKLGEQFSEMLSPYRQQFALQGMDDVAAVRQLVGIYGNLQQNPAETLQWLASNYGVDFQEQGEIDPANHAVMQKMNALESQFVQSQQAQQSAVQQQISSDISAFESAKDNQGNPLHPYFSEVREMMGKMIAGGLAETLDDAYAKAIQMNPEVAQKVSQDMTSRTEREAKEKKKAAAAKAKKAAKGVKSGSNGKQPPEEMTLEDEIRALVEQQS